MNHLTLSNISNAAYFLGLELSTDQLRAAVVDANLTVLGYETVDFDTELHYGTRGGLFSTPGDAYTTPVDMWVKAMDMLFNKLGERFDLGKVKAIGGSAQPATVWLTQDSARKLAALESDNSLAAQIPPTFFSLLHTPVAQDTSTLPQTVALQAALGGPDAMAARVGIAAHPSLPAVQCMKVREGNPDAWVKTGRVMMASTFLSTLLVGRWCSISEAEAMGTGLWNAQQCAWDAAALEVVAGSPEQGTRFRSMLGEVETIAGKNVGTVSQYWVERYGFEKEAIIVPFTSENLAQYLSVCPAQDETVLSFGPQDSLMIPVTQYIPSKLYRLYPHPAQDASEPKKYIAVLTSRNADAARTLVRDMYTKSWTAFDRLVSVIPPGGSIGLDDKLFSFFVLHNESPTSQSIRKGIYRIETGHKVTEFRDLRANPRCLVESQVLSFRVQYARLMSMPLFGGKNMVKRKNMSMSLLAYRTGVCFDPYDKDLCPSKIIAIGSAANFPSIVALIGDVFNAPVFVPTGAPLQSANSPNPMKLEHSPIKGSSPENFGPHTPTPSRCNAALGGAYTARWAWRRQAKPEEKFSSFEEEITGLLKKRWMSPSMFGASGGPNGIPGASLSPGFGLGLSNSTVGYPQPKRSGLASSVYSSNEIDEPAQDTILYRGMNGGLTSPVPGILPQNGFPGLGLGMSQHNLSAGSLNGQLPGAGMPTMPIGRARTPTTSSQATNSTILSQLSTTSINTISTSQTSPGGSKATTPTLSTKPLNVSVNPLPTSDEDSQKGLCKVAEADWDAFMVYASIVPEFCRLEGMLAKGC
ncbi:hypothetical protein FRB94_005896 [Tulasnella sp. JGI-2019a]|nr:hypothetical protein FRB94_005896 [Tulasnella sp. JGI-2019a]